jgi:hypothetical protein
LHGKNLIMLPNSKKNSGFNLKIKSSFFLLFLLMLSLNGTAQIDIQRYTTATDTFYWKRYVHIPEPPRVSLKRFTVSQSGKKVESFLAKYPGEFAQFTSDSSSRTSLKDLKKCLYPIDINGDKLPDMIFSGYDGGESEIVRIWLNRRDSFELIFEDYQYVSLFRKEEGNLVQLQTGDIGHDDNYLYFTRDYRVDKDKNETVFIRGKQTVTYKYTEEPATFYPQPIPFIAKADTMLLRASPAQLNEPFIPCLDTFGNIVAKYRTKSRGIVLAYKSFGRGNNWFFVEMSPSTAPSASILYDIDKVPTFIRGWVSDQSIQLGPK